MLEGKEFNSSLTINTHDIGSVASGVSGSEPKPNSSANLSGNYTNIPSLG